MNYVLHNVHNDKLIIEFLEEVDDEKQGLTFVLIIDYLPLLLDDMAMKFMREKITKD